MGNRTSVKFSFPQMTVIKMVSWMSVRSVMASCQIAMEMVSLISVKTIAIRMACLTFVQSFPE